jgi:hypothetical protein
VRVFNIAKDRAEEFVEEERNREVSPTTTDLSNV